MDFLYELSPLIFELFNPTKEIQESENPLPIEDSLPIEIWKKIFESTSLQNQAIVLPKVCRRFRLIAESTKLQNFLRVAENLLGHRDDLKNIICWVESNNFIPRFLTTKCVCDKFSSIDAIFKDKKLTREMIGWHFQPLPISFDPETRLSEIAIGCLRAVFNLSGYIYIS